MHLRKISHFSACKLRFNIAHQLHSMSTAEKHRTGSSLLNTQSLDPFPYWSSFNGQILTRRNELHGFWLSACLLVKVPAQIYHSCGKEVLPAVLNLIFPKVWMLDFLSSVSLFMQILFCAITFCQSAKFWWTGNMLTLDVNVNVQRNFARQP